MKSKLEVLGSLVGKTVTTDFSFGAYRLEPGDRSLVKEVSDQMIHVVNYPNDPTHRSESWIDLAWIAEIQFKS